MKNEQTIGTAEHHATDARTEAREKVKALIEQRLHIADHEWEKQVQDAERDKFVERIARANELYKRVINKRHQEAQRAALLREQMTENLKRPVHAFRNRGIVIPRPGREVTPIPDLPPDSLPPFQQVSLGPRLREVTPNRAHPGDQVTLFCDRLPDGATAKVYFWVSPYTLAEATIISTKNVPPGTTKVLPGSPESLAGSPNNLPGGPKDLPEDLPGRPKGLLQIDVIVPEPADDGAEELQVYAGEVFVGYSPIYRTNSLQFVSVKFPAPTITSFDTLIIEPGMSVTFKGTGFGCNADDIPTLELVGLPILDYNPYGNTAYICKLVTQKLDITSWNDQLIIAKIPDYNLSTQPAGTDWWTSAEPFLASMKLTTKGGVLTLGPFELLPTYPIIESVSPTEVSRGDSIVILGSGFGRVPGAAGMWVKGLGYKPVTITFWSPTEIVAQIPDFGFPESDLATSVSVGRSYIAHGSGRSNDVSVTYKINIVYQWLDFMKVNDVQFDTGISFPKSDSWWAPTNKYACIFAIHGPNIIGGKGNDYWCPNFHLRHNWKVREISIAVNCVFSEEYAYRSYDWSNPSDGARLEETRVGTSSPYAKVHWWAEAEDYVYYQLIWSIQGPEGNDPYA